MPVGNPITDISSAGNYVPITRTLTINGVAFDLSANRSWTVGTGSVTSVGLIMPTGFAVSSSPVTSAGDLTVAFASGYSLPTTASQATWDSAYTNRITSLTTTGNSGASTLISNTLNVPEYTLAGLGGMANVFTTLGDLVYSNAGGAPVRRSPNITTTKMFLSQTGDGTTSAAPQWSAITAADVNAVPYTGATGNVNLGEFGLTAGFYGLDLTPTGTPTTQGTMFWSVDDETLDVVLDAAVTMKVGQDVFYYVKNQSGVTIPKGTIVRAAGTLGASGRILVEPFLADGSFPSKYVLGVTTESLANGADGFVTEFGKIRLINTSAFADGDILFASPTVAGGFTTTAPTAPNNIVTIAIVIKGGAANGTIFVRPTFGSNINEDEGVKFTGVATGDLLVYNGTFWVNQTKATALSGFVPTSRTITINGTAFDLSADRTYNVGTVTSVALSVPTGLSITGSPITGSGTLAIGLQSGYSIPTTSSQTNWDAAYNDKINSAAVTGTTTKTLTLTQQDGGTITANWTDINTDAVTSVFGRTGAVVAVGGDYNTSQVTELTNLYFTDARARLAISLTTSGTSGLSTYNSTTGVLNVPGYTLSGLGGVPTTRSLTINGTAFDLSADRSWSVGTVTSIALSVPTGLSVSGSPVTSSGTFAISLQAGYSIPTTAKQTEWDSAYTNRITSLTTSGSSGAATLISNTLNVPNYTAAGLGAVPTSRTLTINDVAFDLTADRAWSVGDFGTW